MLRMELPGNRKRGRPKRRLDVVKEDMAEVEVTEEDRPTEDRNNWRRKMVRAL